MRYFLVVGEASGDLHAANLIRALKEEDPQASFQFIGGDLMSQAVGGQEPIVHYRDLAFMGFIPVLMNLGTIRRSAKKMQEEMIKFQPDLVIPIDYAGFNLRYVLPFVKENLDCPIAYYIAPKLWAWKKWRVKKLKKYTDLLLNILPFEQEFFAQYGIPTAYVGNPSAESTLAIREERARGTIPQRKQIAILAGSRLKEIEDNLAVMLEASLPYQNDYEIVVAGAPSMTKVNYENILASYPKVQLRFDETYTILAESELALVTSGTAALETALIGTPQVVCYRFGGIRLGRWIWETFFSIPFVSLANLILGREAIPELLGNEVNVANLQKHIKMLISEGAKRESQLRAIDELRDKLGTEPTAKRTASKIINFLSNL